MLGDDLKRTRIDAHPDTVLVLHMLDNLGQLFKRRAQHVARAGLATGTR